jgi:AraC-like DNA-binding protein
MNTCKGFGSLLPWEYTRRSANTVKENFPLHGRIIKFEELSFYNHTLSLPVMPIYMDVHDVLGAEALDLAEAHRKDLLIQGEHRCKCLTYWFDEVKGNAFCLIEAPNKTAMKEMHRASHGLVPNKIIEVNNDVVEAFLGRTGDPEDAEITDSGLKVFSETAFRVILVTEMKDPVVLRHELGERKSEDLLEKMNSLIRRELTSHAGREVEHAGNGFIASFRSAVKAISCALAIQKNLPTAEKKRSYFRIGVAAGDPVSKSDKVFGDTIQLARLLCSVTHGSSQVVISAAVKVLLTSDQLGKNRKAIHFVLPQEENFLESLFSRLDKNWQDADFGVTEFCRSLSMSKSQLYRKTIALWDLSPIQLLKEYRLNKAMELLKSNRLNVSQATFDSGFTSPSYFTKCFKKKFGLLPAGYLGSLH